MENFRHTQKHERTLTYSSGTFCHYPFFYFFICQFNDILASLYFFSLVSVMFHGIIILKLRLINLRFINLGNSFLGKLLPKFTWNRRGSIHGMFTGVVLCSVVGYCVCCTVLRVVTFCSFVSSYDFGFKVIWCHCGFIHRVRLSFLVYSR